MNEEHPHDPSVEGELSPTQPQDPKEREDSGRTEASMLTRRASKDATESDVTDELAQLFAKPQVWGTVLIAMIVIAIVWAYVDSSSNDVNSSKGWSAYNDHIVAKFTNLQLDTAEEIAGVISTYETDMVADGSLPWARLFKANLLLNKALMPDTSAPPNPLNPSANNKPSLLSGNLDLRRNNLELAILAFNDVVTATNDGDETLLDKMARFRAYYGIAYCEEALMIVGDPKDFADRKLNALEAWKLTLQSVSDGAVSDGLVKLIDNHFQAVQSMSIEDWNEGDSLTEQKFFSWLSKNDPTPTLDPENDPLNPANTKDPRADSKGGTDEARESSLPGININPETKDEEDTSASTDVENP